MKDLWNANKFYSIEEGNFTRVLVIYLFICSLFNETVTAKTMYHQMMG
jgi:hypothetical protein